MEEERLAQPAEALLRDFQRSTDEANAQVLLGRLIQEHARPTIRQVLNSELRFKLSDQHGASHPDAEDVYGEIVLALFKRLRRLRDEPGNQSINNFRSYVAVTAYNACHEYLRQRYPRRWSLVNKLRYLLTHRPEFALWETDEGYWFGGFVGWRHRNFSESEREGVRRLCESPTEIARLKAGQSMKARPDPTASLSAVFEHVGGPIELNQLVALAAELWGIREQPLESLDDEEHSLAQDLSDPRRPHAATIELQFSLRQLWAEVCQLPLRQRASLLLNLRDAEGRDIITLIPYTRTATIQQIAEALEIPLKRLAQLWNKLPLEDAEIAAQLGLTRQQVINLRKCARERLARRMKTVTA
jgi:RNA polymerase sigma factor (sigma-70 family)